MEEESSSVPVGEVLYMSESDRSFVGGSVTLSQLRTEDTRFNLFTGNQTFKQRDQSFEVMSWVWFTLLATCFHCLAFCLCVYPTLPYPLLLHLHAEERNNGDTLWVLQCEWGV